MGQLLPEALFIAMASGTSGPPLSGRSGLLHCASWRRACGATVKSELLIDG